MSVQIGIDSREFDAALRQYAQASNRDMSYIINRAGMNISLRAIRITKHANEAEIRALPSRDWWQKFLTKRLQANMHVTVRKRLAVTQSQFNKNSTYFDLATGRMKTRKLFKVTKKQQGKGYIGRISVGQKRTLSLSGKDRKRDRDLATKKIINARVASINFLRAGFIAAGRAFARAVDKPVDVAKGFGKKDRLRAGVAIGEGIVAKPSDNPSAVIINQAVNRKSDTGAEALMKFAGAGLNKAVQIVSRDMLDWAQRRLQQTASKHSAR